MLKHVLGTAGAVFIAAAACAQTAPLTLRDAVAEALQHSPDLGVPEDQIASAELQQRLARVPFGMQWTPSVNGASGGAYATRSYGIAVDKTLASTGTKLWLSASSLAFGSGGAASLDRGYTLGFTQPITALISGAMKAPLETAGRAVARSRRDLDDARQQLVVTVADAFYAVDAASRLIEASRRSSERAMTLAEAADARAKAGLDTELDVMRAQLLVSQEQAALDDREDAFASACEKLNVVLGRAVDRPCSVQPPEGAADGLTVTSVATPQPVALERRVDVEDGRARVQDAKRAAEISRSNLLPPLTLSVEYDRRGLGSPYAGLFRPLNGWHVSLSTSYQLAHAAQAASVAGADLALQAAEREEQAIEARALVDIRQAERAVLRADKGAALQRDALRIARRQAELAKLRYERGLADNVAVIDAENALFQADSASIAADIDCRLSRLRLARAEGTLDPSTIEP
jgi:outer membrane protein TolC